MLSASGSTAGSARLAPAASARAAALMRVAQQQWQAGAALPADQALPLYLRDKVALTVAERQATRIPSAAAP